MSIQTKPLVYLASPYTNDRADVRQRRFNAVTKVAAELTKQGYLVFCPIAMGHPISLHGCEFHWEAWGEMDRTILSNCCYKLIVLMLDGWQHSKGIAAELQIARELKLPVSYIDPVKWLTNEC